jgi:hypothetical protein
VVVKGITISPTQLAVDGGGNLVVIRTCRAWSRFLDTEISNPFCDLLVVHFGVSAFWCQEVL